MTLPFDAEQELQRHGASLRALAAALLRCDHAADDAVQETWTRALERPPQPGPAGGWLHMVLRNFARKQRRAEVRRSEREQKAARPEALPSASAVAARRESLRLVVDAVLALEEPYQGTLWQRYFEERLPAEIAARSGVSLATVKSRLQRGLCLLRERLDRSKGSGWRAGLLGAFGLQSMVAASAVVAGGAIAMGTGVKVTLAAAVVLCAAVAYVLVGDDRPVPVPEVPVAGAEGGGGTAAAVTVPGERTEQPGLQRSALPEFKLTTDLEHPFVYEVHCTVLDRDGLPVSGTEVFAGPFDGTLNSWPTATDENGTATVAFRARVDGMVIALGVRSGGESSLRRVEVRSGRSELVLGGRRGKETNSYTVKLSRDGGATDRFVMADAKVQALDGLSTKFFTEVNSKLPRGNHPEVGEGTDCRICHATTTLARNAFDSAPAMGALLHPHATFGEPARREKQDLIAVRKAQVRLDTMAVRKLAISLDGSVFSEKVKEGKDPPASLTSVEGTVYGEDGKPAAGVTVICGSAVDRAVVRTTSDKQGNFKIKDAGVVGWAELRAGGGNAGLRRSRVFLQEGQGNRWDPVLERGAVIRGRAVDDTGTPLEGWVVELEGVGWNDECTVQKDGSFLLPNLPGGSYRLLVWAKDGGRKLPALVVPGAMADSGEVLVTVPKQRGSLKVTPFLPLGLVDVPVEVRAFQESSGRGATLARGKKSDEFTIGGLPAGWYRVQIGSELGWLDLGPQWCDGQGECDVGRLALPGGGSLRVQRDAVEGEEGKERTEELCRRFAFGDVRTPFTAGEALPLPAGQYVYLWRDSSGVVQHRSVAVQAGRESVLDVRSEAR